MEEIISKVKGLIDRPRLVLGTAIGLGILIAAKQYFRGGVCRVSRDLTRKVVVVTGGNTGIGKQTILELSKHQCIIIFGARDVNKSQEAIREILKKNPNANITFYPLDLADLRSIDEFSARVREKVPKVDILVNNAAVFFIPKRTLTNSGFEMNMGVNHLGHFYLTHSLWPLIKQAKKPRIINVSALAHKGLSFPHNQNIPIDFNDLHLNNGYTPTLGYIKSKIANILFTVGLQKRMDQINFQGYAYSLHPGVVRTQIDRQLSLLRHVKWLIYPFYYLMTKSAKEGAQTTLYTIMEDVAKLEKGGYYSDCKISKTSQFAGNIQNAGRLWQASENELKIVFRL